MLAYQNTICQFVSQYEFQAWSTYDIAFRQRLAVNPLMSWDRQDDELVNLYVRSGQLRSTCCLCRRPGHFAPTCPERLDVTRPSLPTASSSSQISSSNYHPGLHQPFRAPTGPATITTTGAALITDALTSTDAALATNLILPHTAQNANISHHNSHISTHNCTPTGIAGVPHFVNNFNNVNSDHNHHSQNVSSDHTQHSQNVNSFQFNPLPLHIVSPVNVQVLSYFLRNHPNQDIVNYIVTGFNQGFDTGYSGTITEGSAHNLLSACNNPTAVEAAIQKELRRRHTSGPFTSSPFPTLHCSPLGAVPKKTTHTVLSLTCHHREILQLIRRSHVKNSLFGIYHLTMP